MAFVCKQTAVLVVRLITLDNNNAVLTDFNICLTLYFTTYLSWPDWMYFNSIFGSENIDSFDHYAAFWLPLITT